MTSGGLGTDWPTRFGMIRNDGKGTARNIRITINTVEDVRVLLRNTKTDEVYWGTKAKTFDSWAFDDSIKVLRPGESAAFSFQTNYTSGEGIGEAPDVRWEHYRDPLKITWLGKQ